MINHCRHRQKEVMEFLIPCLFSSFPGSIKNRSYGFRGPGSVLRQNPRSGYFYTVPASIAPVREELPRKNREVIP